MSHIIEARRLTKRYKDVIAVNEISFSLEEGRIYGLLGRNGAGKTTIMSMIAAQIFATSGELKVFGEHPYENNRVLSQLCFIKESQKYPSSFKVEDVLDLSASIFPGWDREYASLLREEFNLPLKRNVSKLSRGMHSTVGIIVGLASRAALTIFDEPYLGLDAVARSMFYNHLIEDYTAHPRTVILSTHLIDEVSKLLEHTLIIDNGKLLLDENTEALREQAFSVVGPTSKVEAFVEGKELLGRESLGGQVSVTVLDKLSAEARIRARELGLELAPVALQRLIIQLTQAMTKKGGMED